jgi:hypothetical protein
LGGVDNSGTPFGAFVRTRVETASGGFVVLAGFDARVDGVSAASSLSLWDTDGGDVVSGLSNTFFVNDVLAFLSNKSSAVLDMSDVADLLAFIVGDAPAVVSGFKVVLVDTVLSANVFGFSQTDLDGSLFADGLFGSSTSGFPVSTGGSSVSLEVVVLSNVLEVLVSSVDDLLHLSTLVERVNFTVGSLVVLARLVVVSLAFFSTCFVVDFEVNFLAFFSVKL